MAEEVKKVTAEQVDAAVKRINDLKNARLDFSSKSEEIEIRQKDLTNAETIYGVASKEYANAKSLLDITFNELEEARAKVENLKFKKSELKDVLDEVAELFSEAFRKDQELEFHIELATDYKDKDGNVVKKADGKKVFKQLLEYLYHNVSFTAKSAASLIVLVRNMEENKAWVNSKEFDNVIVLRSASVLSLQNFIMNDLTGKGFYEARTFLECWAQCGQSLSEAIREFNKQNVTTRELSAKLNLIEAEFNVSEDDLPQDEQCISIEEEVAPEVAE